MPELENNFARVKNCWPIPADMHGLRADVYLQRRVGRISRERAQKIIDCGDFLLNGRHIKPSQRVKCGQVASLYRFAPDHADDILDFDVKIIFEDENILVLDKPPGLSIHPSANCLYKTLTNWLRIKFDNKNIHPAHRIDKETSGLVLCTKNKQYESQIKKQFMAGRIKKTYLAVVSGQPSALRKIDRPLAIQGDRGLVAIKMIDDPNGKPAQTLVRPIFYQAELDRSLILCKPLTGRQHQIRAHLALIGHPIVGDKLYCHGEQFFDDYCRRVENIEDQLIHFRHALHAHALRFSLDGTRFRFVSPLAQDLWHLLRNNTAAF